MDDQHIKDKGNKQRGDLTGEHKLSDAGQITIACLFTVVWMTDSFFFKYSTDLNNHVHLGIRIPLAIVLLFLSVYLAWTGLSIVFGDQREQPELIRKGVFKVIRHPIYLSEILLYLGLLMLSISLIAGAIWLIAIGFLHYISRHEEHLLRMRFGEEYEKYMQEVPMWIPRIIKK
jgi:protein-S-isoprenylcysteine O-methyltransferase Ste14